nr:MAG TPA: hypothetical protein [Crassvirales sp.]
MLLYYLLQNQFYHCISHKLFLLRSHHPNLWLLVSEHIDLLFRI